MGCDMTTLPQAVIGRSIDVSPSVPESPEPRIAPTPEPEFLGYAAMPYTPERFAASMLVSGIELRYNTRSQRQQWRRASVFDLSANASIPAGDWQDWTDNDSITLRAELATAGFEIANRRGIIDGILGVLDLPQKQFDDAVRFIAARNPVDPFLDYLDNDIPLWDGIPRVSVWLSNCFDVADESEDLADWASEFLLIGAIQRAKNPGCKLDETPVLIGPPGIGKSTAPRKLFPPHLEELFTDGLNLGSDSKTRIEALQGRAIVEIGEMAGARRADVESLKAFLSRTDDGSVRLTWRRNPEPLPRRCIVVGTADRNDPLPPDHNLRRFVPISLTGGDVGNLIDFLDRWRGQLWAEALHLYEDGQDARLPDWLKEQQREATNAARVSDAIQDGVERYLEDAPDLFTLEAVAYSLRLIDHEDAGAKVTPVDQQRIGNALRQHGYQKTRRRVNGNLKNVYTR